MEIGKKNAFVEFLKKYGIYCIVGIIVFAIALTFTLVATLHGTVETSTPSLNFRLPMSNSTVIKDYSDTELQNNETLNQWEAHMSVDMTSETGEVFAILDGVVLDVDYNYLDGYIVTIEHSDGFKSIYSSLDENVLVSEGYKVSAGEKIGMASNSANGELDLGSHLHFTLLLNDDHVDPNNYLDLQQK